VKDIGTLHKRSLLVTAALGPLGVLTGSVVLFGSGLASLAAMAWASRELYARERSATRRFTVHAATVALLLLTLLSIRRIGIDAIFVVLLLGIVNRVLLRAGHRDDLLIVGASAVLMSAATVVTSGVGFAMLLITFVPTVAIALWSSVMIGGAEHDAGQHAAVRSRPAPKGMVAIGTASILLTVIFFGGVALLPRYRFAGFLGAGAFAVLPGASDSMTLRVGGLSDRDDATVVLRVEPSQGVTQSDLEGLYARLYALDEFDGQSWFSIEGGHFFPSPRNRPTGSKRVHMSLSRVARKSHHPIAILGRTEPWAFIGDRVHFDLGGTVVVDSMGSRAVEYQISIGDRMVPPEMAAIQQEKAIANGTALPQSLDPRVRKLGLDLISGKTTDQEKIAAILAHFSKGFEYSLDPLEGSIGDPLARFLFEAKHGHCELYAGAVAALLRVAGLRARVVTGYYRGRWNALSGELAFSEGDAHSWVEVHDAEKGWIWVDATPESERARKPSVFGKLRDLFDAIEGLWFDNVVDFDANRQKRLYAAIERQLDRWLDESGVDSTIGAVKSAAEGDASRSIGLVLLPIVGLGVVLVLARRRDPSVLGRRIRRALGERELGKEPLEALAARSPARLEAERAAALYQELRFGPKPQRPDLSESVREAIAALERAKR
jgi:transglutaminase-like putative cysteine protease